MRTYYQSLVRSPTTFFHSITVDRQTFYENSRNFQIPKRIRETLTKSQIFDQNLNASNFEPSQNNIHMP